MSCLCSLGPLTGIYGAFLCAKHSGHRGRLREMEKTGCYRFPGTEPSRWSDSTHTGEPNETQQLQGCGEEAV